MEASLTSVVANMQETRGAVDAPEDEFTVRWFRADVARELAALRAAIRLETHSGLRRAWWACVAEVCRLSSNARLSTPKLQTRPLADLSRPIDIEQRFVAQAQCAIASLARRYAHLEATGLIRDGVYVPGVELRLSDARSLPSSPQADVVFIFPAALR